MKDQRIHELEGSMRLIQTLCGVPSDDACKEILKAVKKALDD